MGWASSGDVGVRVRSTTPVPVIAAVSMLTSSDQEATATVSLRVGPDLHEGSASGSTALSQRPRLVARATLEALRELLGMRCEIEAAQVTLGHEVAGLTDDDTPVAIEPLAPCGTCNPCLDGDYNLCRISGAMLFGIGRDGGMADEMWVPARALVPLPAGIDVRDASLVEPLAVVVHSFRRAAVRPGQRVAVIGGGAIGLCAVAVGRALGCEVGLAARHAGRVMVLDAGANVSAHRRFPATTTW